MDIYNIGVEQSPTDATMYAERGRYKENCGDFIGAIRNYHKAMKFCDKEGTYCIFLFLFYFFPVVLHI